MDCSRPDSAETLLRLGIPEDFGHIHVCKHARTDSHLVLRSLISSEDDVHRFLQKWNEIAHVTWRTSCTNPKNMAAGLKNIYYRRYHCQHGNVKVRKNKSCHPKHMNCKAELTITVKKIRKRCESKDVHLPKFPTIMTLRNDHNHDLFCTDILRWKDVSNRTKEEFVGLFKRGYSPPAALDAFKSNLFVRYGAEYPTIVYNRSVCPDISWCYRLYHSFLKATPLVNADFANIVIVETHDSEGRDDNASSHSNDDATSHISDDAVSHINDNDTFSHISDDAVSHINDNDAYSHISDDAVSHIIDNDTFSHISDDAISHINDNDAFSYSSDDDAFSHNDADNEFSDSSDDDASSHTSDPPDAATKEEVTDLEYFIANIKDEIKTDIEKFKLESKSVAVRELDFEHVQFPFKRVQYYLDAPKRKRKRP